MQNERKRELRRNTVLIAISNIGSKAIVFVLAPLYSFLLTTEEYGRMDLITTTVSLLVPFICFDIFEATFRYTSDQEYDDGKVLSSTLAVAFSGSAVSALFLMIIAILGHANRYIICTGVAIILEVFNSVLKQFARGRSQMKAFSFAGVIDAITLLAANLVFLVLLKYRLDGWLISFLLGKVVTALFLIKKTDCFQICSIRKIDHSYIATFVHFCLPLLPTTMMWWIMNASDRYMIAFFLGAAANGIYSVANKIPSILSIFEQIFYQAWQTTAIKTADDRNRNEVYSSVLTNYIMILGLGVSLLLIVVKPILLFLFSANYSDAWKCLPILLTGIIFHSIGSHLGSLYSVFKLTNGAFKTTIVGALTNIILNLFAIPRFGIMGAATTTLIGYVVTCVYRWHDIKKFVSLKLGLRKILPFLIAFPVSFVLYYWDSPISYILRVLIALSLLLINKKPLLSLIK